MALTPPAVTDWVTDVGALNHTTSGADNLTSIRPPTSTDPTSIIVGNGSALPVISVGDSALPGLFYLNNVHVSPDIIQNLLSVRRFTTDNWYSMEFDPFGLFVKDLSTWNVITRCNSSGPLYTMCLPLHPAPSSHVVAPLAQVASASTWHQRLGHPSVDVLSKLSHDSSVICSRRTHDLCHVCQLNRHTRMPFVSSNSRACVSTQFGRTIKAVQCDNGRQFDNASSRAFFATNGVILRMSCPYTSPQNNKAKRILRTINNTMHSLLFQASISARYWVEGLHTTTYLVNHLPTKAISVTSPYVALHGVVASYEHLRMFSCACYPNLSTKATHKLAPKSTRCVFLEYSVDQKGYRSLYLITNNIVVSRHVVFDEANFLFSISPHLTNDLDIFLQNESPSAAPMAAPLPTSHFPLGFLPLAVASGQIAHPGGQTALGIEASGLTASPGGQATPRTEAGGLTVPQAVRMPMEQRLVI
jgi:hypothetical protein